MDEADDVSLMPGAAMFRRRAAKKREKADQAKAKEEATLKAKENTSKFAAKLGAKAWGKAKAPTSAVNQSRVHPAEVSSTADAPSSSPVEPVISNVFPSPSIKYMNPEEVSSIKDG